MVLHRDLKATNLLIDRKWRVKVSDFGISRVKKASAVGHDMQTTSTAVGTPAYMAPETITRNAYSEASDIFALGIVLGELVDGQVPYADLDMFPQQIMYAVVHEGLRPTIADTCPDALRQLINEATHATPSKRPLIAEVKARLKRLS